jgi:hypothetical protein
MFAVWPACNRDRDLADEPHWCSLVFGCRNACGLADRIDILEYSLCRKRGVGSGGHICRAGFLCETARGDFRFGDTIENGARQGRAPLRAVARTRASAERPVSLDKCGSGLSTAILDQKNQDHF